MHHDHPITFSTDQDFNLSWSTLKILKKHWFNHKKKWRHNWFDKQNENNNKEDNMDGKKSIGAVDVGDRWTR